jgi:hypothetical protein
MKVLSQNILLQLLLNAVGSLEEKHNASSAERDIAMNYITFAS